MSRASRHAPPRIAPPALVLMALVALPLAAADSPWSVTVTAGEARVDAALTSELSRHLDSDATSRSVSVAYRLHPRLEIEAGLHDLGSYRGVARLCPPESPDCIERFVQEAQALGLCAIPDPECLGPDIFGGLETEISARSLSLVPRWPLKERFVVFARAGVIDWNGDLSVPAIARSDRFSGQDLLLGTGLEVALAGGFALDVEYHQFDFDYRSTTAGVRWRF